MRKPRFYTPDLDLSQMTFSLPESAHRHAVQVLRLKPGALIRCFDGLDNEVEAELVEVEKRHSTAHIKTMINQQTQPRLDVTLIQGVSRGERMDFAIQKAVELGVNTIIPVLSERCTVHLDEKRWAKRMQHWQGVIVSACEQSGRSRLPILQTVMPIEQALTLQPGSVGLVLDPLATDTLASVNKPEALSLLIGPEGGLTEAEIQFAITAGFQTIQFGPRILRTETAALAVMTAAQTLWGDLM